MHQLKNDLTVNNIKSNHRKFCRSTKFSEYARNFEFELKTFGLLFRPEPCSVEGVFDVCNRRQTKTVVCTIFYEFCVFCL